MTAITNQQTSLSSLVTLDGVEITEHNRRLSSDTNPNGSIVSLSRGLDKKYFRKAKRSFTLTFSMLPSSTDHTVDGRAGRKYLKDKTEAKSSYPFTIKDVSNNYSYSTTVFITSYNEQLVRRDFSEGYDFYDVSITFEEA